jgi:hypothetical protein
MLDRIEGASLVMGEDLKGFEKFKKIYFANWALVSVA